MKSPDPYAVLGLTGDADEAAIRAAFHERVRQGTADAAVNAAYGSIRDQAGRDRVRWGTVTGLIAAAPALDPVKVADDAELAALVRELAFLSDWELGATDA